MLDPRTRAHSVLGSGGAVAVAATGCTVLIGRDVRVCKGDGNQRIRTNKQPGPAGNQGASHGF